MATATSAGRDKILKREGVLKRDSVGKALEKALDVGGWLVRLTPTWVPRSFLHPGKRIKLAPGDWYAFGAHRGGIDERWFASTTEAANDNRTPDEGLSYVAAEGGRTQISLRNLRKLDCVAIIDQSDPLAMLTAKR